MALEIAVLTGVTQADGSTLLAGSTHAVASDPRYAETVADCLGIRAEYNSSLCSGGIMEIPVSRLLDLAIDTRRDEINGVNLTEHVYNAWDREEFEAWDSSGLADAQIAARAPGARIMVKG